MKITPFLWFDGRVEEAMNFYVSVFKNSRVTNVTPGPDGTTRTPASPSGSWRR